MILLFSAIRAFIVVAILSEIFLMLDGIGQISTGLRWQGLGQTLAAIAILCLTIWPWRIVTIKKAGLIAERDGKHERT